MSGKKGMTHYSVEIKLQAIQLHEEGGLTYAQVAEQLQIRKAERIEKWARQYRDEGEAGLSKQGGGRPRKGRTEQGRLEQLEMENALLKKFHTELRTGMLAKRNIGSSNTTERNIR